ncbi:hypothetical protein CIT292_07851 [Citrobacter youngae ATCC 29220]|uniref:Uncharacterized protein n=1 Tax=Citrobacter youngae ATCC 29220 TaxID=500640 RepID=D4BBR1_9ENTR|nr:hypothetical protein CIT292_07851 [Citrobacter youngae ATCC 29220]
MFFSLLLKTRLYRNPHHYTPGKRRETDVMTRGSSQAGYSFLQMPKKLIF